MALTTITANDVADQLLWIGHEHGSFVSNLKLQKLLYYAQGWHLALFKEVLFPDPIEAWVHGPVVPDVYHRFKAYRFRNIDESVVPPALSVMITDFMRDLTRHYLGLDAYALELMTHQEAPWQEARGTLRPDQSSRTTISPDSMRDYFREQLLKLQSLG